MQRAVLHHSLMCTSGPTLPNHVRWNRWLTDFSFYGPGTHWSLLRVGRAPGSVAPSLHTTPPLVCEQMCSIFLRSLVCPCLPKSSSSWKTDSGVGTLSLRMRLEFKQFGRRTQWAGLSHLDARSLPNSASRCLHTGRDFIALMLAVDGMEMCTQPWDFVVGIMCGIWS